MNCPPTDLDIDVIWQNTSTGQIMKQGRGSTYSGQSGYSLFEINNLQIRFQHGNNDYSGIYYDDDGTGTPRWNGLNATQGFDLVKFVITPHKRTGIKGDQGETGVQGLQGEVGPKGEKGDAGFTALPWDNTTTYNSDEVSICDGVAWISLTDNNLNNNPTSTEGTNWNKFYAISSDEFDFSIGSIFDFSGKNISTGFIALDNTNQLLLIADYPKLFSKLGTKYGGDGITDFALPTIEQVYPEAYDWKEFWTDYSNTDWTISITMPDGKYRLNISYSTNSRDFITFGVDRENNPLSTTFYGVWDAGYNVVYDITNNTLRTDNTAHYVRAVEKWDRILPENITPCIYVGNGSLSHTTDTNIDNRLIELENRKETYNARLHMKHILPANTDSGNITSGGWNDGPLNTICTNDITGASLNINTGTFTLPQGKYYIHGYRGIFYCNNFTVRLLDITHNYTCATVGGNSNANAGYNSDRAIFSCVLDVEETSEFIVQAWTQSSRTDGAWGYDHSTATGPEHKTWADVMVEDLTTSQGLQGEKGDQGDSIIGPQGDPGITVPDINSLTEITSLNSLNDELIIYDTENNTHKKIKTKNLKDNYVEEILGKNLYNQFILKMADNTYRASCGTSTASNMILGNGRSDRVIHNQQWPMIPNARGKVIKQIDVRGVLAAVLYEDGTLWNCGYNDVGQQGTNNTTDQYRFIQSATDVKRFWISECQSYSHTYVHWFHEKNDGTIWGCGHNGNGALGIGSTTNQDEWVQITFFNDKTVLEMYPRGAYHQATFATTDDGKIWVCGYNGYGQLGTGDTTQHTSFIDISSEWGGFTTGTGGNIVSINSAHGYYSDTYHGQTTIAMLREDGMVRTCGDNDWGQIGDGTTTDRKSPFVVPISSVFGQYYTIAQCQIKQLCIVGDGPCTFYARNAEGNLIRWGYNSFGQIGDGTTTQRLSPYMSSDYDNIDHHCKNILLNDTSTHTYGHYSNQFVVDDRDDSIWGVGCDTDFMVGTVQGDAVSKKEFTRVAFPDDVIIVQANTGGYGTANHYIHFLDDKGRVWVTGDSGRYNTPVVGTYHTASFPLPMLVDIK